MQAVLAILSAGLLGIIIYFAVSPRSSRLLKLVSLIALGLIALSVVVCGILLIKGPDEDPNAISLPVFEEVSPHVKNSNMTAVFLFLAIFLFILGLMTAIALRAQRTKGGTVNKAKDTPVFSDVPELDDLNNKEPEEEDSFDIGFE